MNPLEDRLRDAYRAAAETVRPQTVLPAGIGRRHRRDRRPARRARARLSRGRLLVPLAAAAAVTAVVVGASALAPHAAPRPPRTTPVAGGRTPRFFVALDWTTHPSLFVVNAATGARKAGISLPFAASGPRGVATGDGRTFVVAAPEPGACRTFLYRFALTARGTSTALTRFATVPGLIESPWDMAMAGNGRTIAYDTLACGQARRGYLAVVNAATGQIRRWTFESGAGRGPQALTEPADVSLSADGRAVAFRDWVVRTDAAPGSLVRRGRPVVRNGELGASTILGGLEIAPDGTTVYFDTFRVRHDKPAGRNWQLRAFDLATGRTHLVRSIPGSQGTPAAVAPDPAGRNLMIEYVPRAGATRLARLDVATGQLTRLTAWRLTEAAVAW